MKTTNNLDARITSDDLRSERTYKQPTGDTAKVFSPSYSGGLEIVNLTDPTDDEGPEYRIQMAKNGAFVAMTRSLVDARMIQAMPEILACLKENIDTFNPVLEGTEWGMRVKRAHEVIAKAEGQK